MKLALLSLIAGLVLGARLARRRRVVPLPALGPRVPMNGELPQEWQARAAQVRRRPPTFLR